MGRFGALLKDEEGVVLVVVVMFSVVVVVSGLAFLSLTGSGSTVLTRPLEEAEVLYLTEGRMRKAIWRMSRASSSQWETYGSFSDTTSDGVVTVAYSDSTNTLICTGVIGEASKTLSINVRIDRPTDHVIAYTNSFVQKGGSGTLTYGAGAGPAQFDALPTVDMVYYGSRADTSYLGDQTFTNPLSAGIHFINGDVDVKTGTTLNGTIVATGTIRFFGGSTITAQPVPGDTLTYYPAIVSFGSSVSDVTGGSSGLYIDGLVYANGEVNLNPCNVDGSIIAEDIELQGSYGVVYDPKCGNPPPGFIWPEGSFSMSVGSWTED